MGNLRPQIRPVGSKLKKHSLTNQIHRPNACITCLLLASKNCSLTVFCGICFILRGVTSARSAFTRSICLPNFIASAFPQTGSNGTGNGGNTTAFCCCAWAMSKLKYKWNKPKRYHAWQPAWWWKMAEWKKFEVTWPTAHWKLWGDSQLQPAWTS